MDKIVKKARVVYTDGVCEDYEIVRITKKGVVIGRIIDGEFVDCGFIPKSNVKEVIK